MTRLEANRKILEKIQQKIEEYPDLRFGQILWSLGILEFKKSIKINDFSEDSYEMRDPFYEESVITLKRIEK